MTKNPFAKKMTAIKAKPMKANKPMDAAMKVLSKGKGKV